MTGTAADAARGEAEARRRAGLVERAVFDTAAFPEAERLVQFQHIVGAAGLIQPRAASFHARVLTYWLGQTRMRLFETAPYRVERIQAKIDSDRLDHVMIVHLIQGRARGDFAACRSRRRRGRSTASTSPGRAGSRPTTTRCATS